MTDDSYPHTFKKRVQIKKRGGISHWGGDLHSSCMFADFFLRKGDQSLLRRGYVPSCCNVCSYQGVDEEAEPGAHGSFFQGVFAP